MQLDQDDTKTRIFFAGIKVFAACGYKAATVRDICKEAGAANINAINYYFGSKAGLYRTILDLMHAELGVRWTKIDEDIPADTPNEERLKHYMRVYCELLYAEDELTRQFTTIFLGELASPSEYLDEALKRRVLPQAEKFYGLIGSIVGPGADPLLLRRCFASVLGPMLYPVLTRSHIESCFGKNMVGDLEGFVDHAHRFAMAGLLDARSRKDNA